VFALLNVGWVLTPILNGCAMANHFCALVLFECACDMDHESATRYIISPYAVCARRDSQGSIHLG